MCQCGMRLVNQSTVQVMNLQTTCRTITLKKYENVWTIENTLIF